jgi:hypothetical protein
MVGREKLSQVPAFAAAASWSAAARVISAGEPSKGRRFFGFCRSF